MKTTFCWKKGQIIIWVILALALATLPAPTTQPVLAQAGPPLMFIENVGQFPTSAAEEVLRFQVSGGQVTLSLTEQALWFTITERSSGDTSEHFIEPTNRESAGTQSANTLQRGVTLKLSFLDANPQPRLEPFNRLDTHVSYFVGNDPSLWRGDVPVWGGVRYVDLYPGLDLEVTGENGQLVQRFVVKEEVTIAGASSPDNIRWQVEGADTLSLENDHQLRLNTAIGDLNLSLPQPVYDPGNQRAGNNKPLLFERLRAGFTSRTAGSNRRYLRPALQHFPGWQQQ
jgi:hypothetical protein